MGWGPRGERGLGTPFWGRSSGWEGLAREEAVGAGREIGEAWRAGATRPCALRSRFVQLFLHLFPSQPDSNLQMRQVRLVELHPAGQAKPERPGHRPRAETMAPAEGTRIFPVLQR